MPLLTDSKPFIRPDGPDKVTGSGRYVADITLTGMLTAKFLYAGVSHATIIRLDVSAARRVPGVFAVLTQEDVPDRRFGSIADRTLFAKDVVRFEGEVIAAVAAVDARTAEKALDAVVVEYEPMPTVTDLEAAIAEGATLVHEGWADYEAANVERDGNVASFTSMTRGDVERGMAEADQVISSRYVADASHAAPIEPRGVLAQWGGRSGDGLELHSGPVPSPGWSLRDPRSLHQSCENHRSAHGWRFRRQVRFPLRSTHRRPRKGSPPTRPTGVLSGRGIPCS